MPVLPWYGLLHGMVNTSCLINLSNAQATWDDTGITWDGWERTWSGQAYWLSSEDAKWDDDDVLWDSWITNWDGTRCIELINVLQMREDQQPWQTLSSSLENNLITQHWKSLFPPPAITCWALEWSNGCIVYYRWIQQNACYGCRDSAVPPALTGMVHA